MRAMKKKLLRFMAVIVLTCIVMPCLPADFAPAFAGDGMSTEEDMSATQTRRKSGGGYAATGQIEGVGYSAVLYDAENGLPTSDANVIMSSATGYIWIGGYSGIIRYDGIQFDRLLPQPQTMYEGLTSGKALFEDSAGRMWVGTNDNGVVIIDGQESKRFTYKDDLPSSSVYAFAENSEKTVYIGTTAGMAYAGPDMELHRLDIPELKDETIKRLQTRSNDTVCGYTKKGNIFIIRGTRLLKFYNGKDLDIGNVSAFFADSDGDTVYIGTDRGKVYEAHFDNDLKDLRMLNVPESGSISWIARASDRIWVLSDSKIGYFDENNIKFNILENIPLKSSIEMMTEDYQGNLWFASSRQGVMKLVTNNFKDLSQSAGLEKTVVNSTCLFNGKLYIGTENGLQIIDNDTPVENELTEYLEGTRIRCIMKDNNGNLWISTYTNSRGLVCYSMNGQIRNYTMSDGMPTDKIRCTSLGRDGSVLAGTNNGLAIIRNGSVIKTITEEEVLTCAEGSDGKIYIGTDGDGLYIADGDNITRKGRDDGLTSDVILRLKRDDQRKVMWIITSNSIEYVKNGSLREVKSFPYNNNYDLYFDINENIWILSSYGVYCVNADDMLNDSINEYKLYNIANGLPSAPTANAFSTREDTGNLYIAGRYGVSSVNIDSFFDYTSEIKIGVDFVLCDDTRIYPEAGGSSGAAETYVIPDSAGRVRIRAAILDYTMSNPMVHMYLEGYDDAGITKHQQDLTSLDYTELPKGNYKLHIELIDAANDLVYQEKIFNIKKQPRMMELTVIRILLAALLVAVAGFVVWRIMSGTVIRRQYEQIRAAKDDAERANSAKTRFLANISSEIRTPINTIMGMDELLLREKADDVPKHYYTSVKNYATDIRGASESLLELINDILDLSQIESGQMHLIEQEYDVEEMLRNVIVPTRVRSNENNLEFTVDIDKQLPCRLYGDSGKIRQIVLNLLTYAVKYTEVGKVGLKAAVLTKENGICRILFSVTDHGASVNAEEITKLFDAFNSFEERHDNAHSTGLGLDISRRFTQLLGGELKCESTQDEGVMFSFTLDQKIVDESEIGEFDENKETASDKAYVPQFCAPDADVLVVDPNPMDLTVIKGMLAETKIFITTAQTGEECMQKIKYGSFNVVLLDDMISGMGGVEPIEWIREKYPDLPVYALTSNASSVGDDYYKNKGFNGFLTKPIDSKLLEKAIMEHIPGEIMRKNENV